MELAIRNEIPCNYKKPPTLESVTYEGTDRGKGISIMLLIFTIC